MTSKEADFKCFLGQSKTDDAHSNLKILPSFSFLFTYPLCLGMIWRQENKATKQIC